METMGAFEKYRLVYGHLLRTYGRSGAVWFSFALSLAVRICKVVLLPIAVSLIITHLSTQDFDRAFWAVLFFVSVSFGIGVLAPLVKYVSMRGENPVYRDLLSDYFDKLVHADMEYFHSNLGGYLTTATRQYSDNCIQLVRSLRDRYMGTVLSIVLPIGVIFWVDVWVGLVALGLTVTQALYILWSSKMVQVLRERSRELYKVNSGYMSDVITNILTVRSTAREHHYVAHVNEAGRKEANVFSVRYAKQAKLVAFREMITVLFFAGLLWMVVERMGSGAIDITGAILVVTYSVPVLGAIYMLNDDLDQHDDYIDKIIPGFTVLNRVNVVQDPETPAPMDTVKGQIEVRNVSYAYGEQEKGRAVLKNLSLTIPAGQRVGVVGLSGAGKSTLTKLLMRFNDVDEGAILIDGTDIRDVLQSDLRRQIGYVPQEPLLLHTTIKENVRVAKPDATDAEIEQALKKAHAWDFVSRLPKGVESVVGERGVKLSGGQKQRVAIARTVLEEAPIMVLDEATSALDSESEEIVKRSFKEVLEGKTAIVVAHRLSTLSDMDRIIVIEDGRLIEDGTHEALVKKRGVYAELWRKQSKGEEIL